MVGKIDTSKLSTFGELTAEDVTMMQNKLKAQDLEIETLKL